MCEARIFLLPMMLAFCSCSSVQPWTLTEGQHEHSFQKTITKAVNSHFLVFLPKGSASAKKLWPMIIFLHGAGERGEDIERVKGHGPPKLVEAQPDFPFIVVSPQVPENSAWDSDVLDALLQELLHHLPIDSDRIYLTGLSMGGYGTWSFATDHPDRFAAIAPISGAGDPDRACLLKNLPIWAFHGGNDPVVHLKDDQDMVDAVRDCGGNIKFTVYPDEGHDVWTRTYSNPELYQWFLEHQRHPMTKN